MDRNNLSRENTLKQIAEEAMQSTKNEIDTVNNLGSSARATNSNYLMEWQKWISTISFSLVAIGGALLINGDPPHPVIFISFVLFLIVGVWILVVHKRYFEKASNSSTLDVDNIRPLYDAKLRAAYELFKDPTDVNKSLLFMQKKLEILRFKKKLLREIKLDMGQDKIEYFNDIWLGLFVTGLYLLLYPMYEKSHIVFVLGNSNYSSLILYWLILVIFILFILNDSLADKAYIVQAQDSRKAKLKSDELLLDYSVKELEEQIMQIKKMTDAK